MIAEVLAGGPMTTFNTDGSYISANPIRFRVKAYNADGWQAAWSTFELLLTPALAFIGPNIGAVAMSENVASGIAVAFRFQGQLADYELTGTLPDGLVFSETTGNISGTPTTAGVTTGLVITGTDGVYTVDSDTFSITVAAAEEPGSTGVPLQSRRQNSIRTQTSFRSNYDSDFRAYITSEMQGISGSSNELMVQWLRSRLNSQSTSLPALQAEAAADRGVSRWQEISDPTEIGT
jgi:hypothetical protein